MGEQPRPGGASVQRSDGSFSIGSPVWPGLSKLIEEMGEVAQVVGKIMGSHGDPNHWDGSDLRERLVEELGDLAAAIRFVIDANGLDDLALTKRAIVKGNTFGRWHAEGLDNRPDQNTEEA